MKNILDIYFYVKNKWENTPEFDQAFYHGWVHTKNFYDAVCYLAPLEGINDHDTMILKLAALYHDTGYLNGGEDNHEYRSAVIARKDLQSFGFSDLDIDQICSLIVSTMFHNRPVGILEEILRDADFEYLGRDYYPFVSELLRKEKKVELTVWKIEQISFLREHRFLTSSARLIFDNQKGKNLRMLEEQIK